MSNLTEAEIKKLKEVAGENWDQLCNEIRRAHGGQYPDDWYQVVILGKLAPNIDIEIHIE